MDAFELDKRRAALCCHALKHNSLKDVERLFQKYRYLNFHKIVISPDTRKKDSEKLLFATAVDTGDKPVVYVAFKGNSKLSDVLHGSQKGDLLTLSTNQSGQGYGAQASGFFHESFRERLLCSVPSVYAIVQFAKALTLQSASSLFHSLHDRCVFPTADLKIVFCGHGSGGAISQMAMLTNLLYISSFSSLGSRSASTVRDILDNLISISFGAPLFCSEETVSSFSSSFNEQFDSTLEKHLINFFTPLDPVPFLLLDVPSQEGNGSYNYEKVREEYSRLLDEVESVIDGPQVGSLDTDEHLTKLHKSLSRLEKSTFINLASLNEKVRLIEGSYPYGRIGSFRDITVQDTCSVSSAITGDSDFKMRPSFGQVENVEAHSMTSYFKASVPSSERFTTHSSNVLATVTVTAGDPPEVEDAFLVFVEGKGRRSKKALIEVRGRNLSPLLRGKCTISRLHADRWSVTEESCEMIRWETTELGETILKELSDSGRRTKIRVETVFGYTNFMEVRLKSSSEGSCAIEGLKHALGKMAIVAGIKGPHSLSLDALEIQKAIARIPAAGISGGLVEEMDGVLKKPDLSSEEKKRYLNENILEIVCQELCEKPLDVAFENNELRGKFVLYCLIECAETLFSFLTPVPGVMALGVVVILGLKGIELLVQYVLQRKHALNLRTYYEIMKFSHALLFFRPKGHSGSQEDQHLSSGSNDNSPPDSTVDALRYWERKLYKHVEQYGPETISFSSGLKYKREDLDGVKDRIRLVHSVLRSYYEAKRRIKLLAVVGFENAGKSTLINLLRSKRDRLPGFQEDTDYTPEAETGFRSHTASAQGYYLRKNWIAVDFPGVGGVDASRSNTWEQFELVADLCIVMVRFSGDVNGTSQRLRNIFAEKLCRRCILLVNHVDCVMKGPPKSKVWTEYTPEMMKALQENYRRGLGGKEDASYMCCLKDEDLYEQERQALKHRGVLFGDDVARKVFELLGETHLEE